MTYNFTEIEKTLLDYIDFERISEERVNSDNFGEYLDWDEIDMCWNVSAGATKMCFIPKDDEKQYVIKVPFNADVEWNCEEEEYFSFYNAVYPLDHERGWDYCKSEVQYFELAAQAGLDDFFAETMYLATRADYPIYIQERCVFEQEKPKKEYYDLAEKLAQEDRRYYYMTQRFVAYLLTMYSARQIEDLLSFLSNEDIGDLNESNCGFAVEFGYRPVLTDYAGYWE